MSKIKLQLAASYYSVVEWLGYELWILRPWVGSQSCHIEFFFFSKFATEILSLKMEHCGWRDLHFMEICWSEISRDLEISYKFQVETWSRMS